ncbi:MAG: hypothetical protein LUI06_02010 [Ruminococcus sp.]|nr:hypothetical protein [Ruminococcus sp.]
MKKTASAFLIAMSALMLASCGDINSAEDEAAAQSSSVEQTTADDASDVTDESSDEDESSQTESDDDTEIVRGIDLSNSDETNVIKVGLKGEFSSSTYIVDLCNINVLHTDLVGRFGSPIEIASDSFTKGTIVFEYDPDNMKNVPAENLILLHYNEENDFYDTVESVLREDDNTVAASITEAGVYMLADAYEWYSVWGLDVSEYSAHDNTYVDSDYGFTITVPQEVSLKYVSSYLEDDEEGQCQTLLESYSGSLQIGIEYLSRPTYSSAEEFVNAIAGGITNNGYTVQTGTLVGSGSDTGYYFYVDFSDSVDYNQYSLNCVYQINETEYINIWYGFTDEEYYAEAISSLKSFCFN